MFHDIYEHTPEWYEIRKANVGGSEVAALRGHQPAYGLSRYALWYVKAGKIEAPHTSPERAEWGQEFEPTIARIAAKKSGWKIYKGSYVTDDTTPGMGASLDYVIEEPGEAETKKGWTGPGALQVKMVDWLQHKRGWTGNQPPLHIILQLQHELACTGWGWGYVACLIGGNDLKLYPYEARPRAVDMLRSDVAEFWQSIRDNRPPQVDGSDTTEDALRLMFPVIDPDPDPVDMTDDPELSEICFGVITAAADRLAAEKIEQEYKNRLRARMADHKCAVADGYRIDVSITPATETRKETRRLNVKEYT